MLTEVCDDGEHKPFAELERGWVGSDLLPRKFKLTHIVKLPKVDFEPPSKQNYLPTREKKSCIHSVYNKINIIHSRNFK